MIGRKIAELRKKHKMTQLEFAKRVHVTQSAVSQWETGRTYPDTFQLLQIAEIFQVDLNELTTDKVDPTELANMRFQMDVPLKNGDSMIPRANQARLQAKTDKGNDLVSRLQKLSPERVQQALDYIKFLEQQEETDE